MHGSGSDSDSGPMFWSQNFPTLIPVVKKKLIPIPTPVPNWSNLEPVPVPTPIPESESPIFDIDVESCIRSILMGRYLHSAIRLVFFSKLLKVFLKHLLVQQV